MAARAKSSRRRQKRLSTTFEAPSPKPAVEESSFYQMENVQDIDEHVVFFCGKCKLTVGDSLSWDGTEEGQNQIRLQRVTANVVVGEENRLHEVKKQPKCLISDLTCRGCNSVIGMVYTSTPRSLDYKRHGFFLSVAQIDSYVFGSASCASAAEGPIEQPVTMEYQATVDQQLREMKILLLTMGDRLEEIEAVL